MSLPPRFARKPDANQPVIIAALEKAGALVQDMSLMGGGFPDILVGYKSCFYLLELKTSKGKLNKLQRPWHIKWAGYKVYVVRSAEEALEVIGVTYQ